MKTYRPYCAGFIVLYVLVLISLADAGWSLYGQISGTGNQFMQSFSFFSYLIAALSPIPLLSLAGCALCGLSVAIMWPGTYSLASSRIPFGGVRMFALLAMAGDIGCLVGPTSVGWIAELFGNDLRVAFLFSALFPLLIILLMILGLKKTRKKL